MLPVPNHDVKATISPQLTPSSLRKLGRLDGTLVRIAIAIPAVSAPIAGISGDPHMASQIFGAIAATMIVSLPPIVIMILMSQKSRNWLTPRLKSKRIVTSSMVAIP
jgi:hypothetical protein